MIIGVAIGVAMIVAIDLANGAADRAFDLGTQAVAGRTTHSIVAGPSGLDESVYFDLRREVGYRLSAPVIEDYVLVDELDSQPMRLLAIDPFAEEPFRSYLGGGNGTDAVRGYLTKFMVQPNMCLWTKIIH